MPVGDSKRAICAWPLGTLLLLLETLSLSLLVVVLGVTDSDGSVALSARWTVGAVVGLIKGGVDGDVEGLLGMSVAAVDEKVAEGAVLFVLLVVVWGNTATVRSRTEYRVCIKAVWIG